MKVYWLMALIYVCLCSCRHQHSFNEEICSQYVGKEIIYFPDSDLVNKDMSNSSRHKLIHTMDITCSSCVYEIVNNQSFIEEVKNHNISFEIIGYSSYKDSIFSDVLLQNPFYFDFYRKFRSRNNLKDENITKTFLLDGKTILLVGDMKDAEFRKQVINYIKSDSWSGYS